MAVFPAARGVVSVIGRRRRRGRWTLPPRFRALAWMGGIELDLREADIPPEGVDLELVAVMGVIEVVVPADLVVCLIDDAVTWSVEAATGEGAVTAPRGELRVHGRAVLGRVHVRLQGERSEDFVRADRYSTT